MILRTKTLHIAFVWASCIAGVAAVSACSSKKSGASLTATDGGPDSGSNMHATGGNGGHGGTGGTMNHGGGGTGGTGGTHPNVGGMAGMPTMADAGPDSSMGNDASMDASDGSMSGQIAFAVPAGGGPVPFAIGGDTVITFNFPASAAGMNITLTVGAPTDIGWASSDFSTVIKMEPDHTVFADPVIVSSSNHELLALSLPQTSVQSKPEVLALAADKSGQELNHFSFLAFVPPNQWCESSAWNDTPNSAQCASAGTATTYRSYGCKNYRFCSIITANCCVEPTDAGAEAGCGLDAQLVGFTFITTGSNGGQYPYCDTPVDGGTVDGGDGGSVLMTCSEAAAALGAGQSDGGVSSAELCMGDSGAACAVALDWTLGVSCNSFCATIGKSCAYAATDFGSNPGADCSATYTVSQQPSDCATQTDADVYCECN